MVLHAKSHVDHDLSQAHLDWLLDRFADRDAFFIETVELPEHLGDVPCGLYGPAVGDPPVPESEVTYAVRGAARRCTTRLTNKPPRMSRKLTVVGGPCDEHACILYTSYGGPQAPREPGDLTIGSWAEVVEARAFWADHALAGGAS